jgi:predicted Zn-dependent peptidase
MSPIFLSIRYFRIAAIILPLGLFLTVEVDAQFRRFRKSVELPDHYQQYLERETIGRSVRGKLRNGMGVMVEEHSKRPIAAVVLRIGSGYADEVTGKPGAAAGLEWFIRYRSRIPSRVTAIGGIWESRTSDRETVFIAVVPSAAVGKTVEILGDLLRFAETKDSPNQIQIPLVTGNGYEEWISGFSALPKLWMTAFPGKGRQLAAMEIAGVPIDSEGISLSNMLEFHELNYVPNNVVLAVSGAVVRGSVLSKAAEVFSAFKKQELVRKKKDRNTELEGVFGYEQFRIESDNPKIYFGFRIPGQSNPDLAVLRLIAVAMDEGNTSLFEKHLIGAGITREARIELWPSELGGLMVFELQPSPGKVDAAELRFLALINTLHEFGLQPEELQRAKIQLVRQKLNDLRSVECRALILSREFESKAWQDLIQGTRDFLMVENDHVREIAKRYLTTSRASLLEMMPASSPERAFSVGAIEETFNLLLPAAMKTLVREEEGTPQIVEIPLIEMRDLPIDKRSRKLRRTSVLRGPVIFLEEEHTVPLVDVGFFFPGGRIEESKEKDGVTALMLRSLALDQSAGEDWDFWRFMESRGSLVEVVSEPEFFGYRVQVPAYYLTDILPDFLKWIRRARVTRSRFEKARSQLKTLQGESQSTLFRSAVARLYRNLFPDHPYGREGYGQRSDSLKLEFEGVKAWHAQKMQMIHPVIVLYGDVQGTAFLPELIPILSDSKYKYKKEVRNPPDHPEDPPLLLKLLEGVTIGAIRGPARGTRDDWILDVVRNLIELKGTRASKRGEEEFPADIRIIKSSFNDAGAILIQKKFDTGFDGDNAWMERLASLEDTRITEDEIRVSVARTTTEFYRRAEDGGSYLLDLARNLLAGEKVNFQDEYLITLHSIQPDDVRSTASRFFRKMAHFNKPEVWSGK